MWICGTTRCVVNIRVLCLLDPLSLSSALMSVNKDFTSSTSLYSFRCPGIIWISAKSKSSQSVWCCLNLFYFLNRCPMCKVWWCANRADEGRERLSGLVTKPRGHVSWGGTCPGGTCPEGASVQFSSQANMCPKNIQYSWTAFVSFQPRLF